MGDERCGSSGSPGDSSRKRAIYKKQKKNTGGDLFFTSLSEEDEPEERVSPQSQARNFGLNKSVPRAMPLRKVLVIEVT